MRQSPLSCIQPLIVANFYIYIYIMEVFQKQVLYTYIIHTCAYFPMQTNLDLWIRNVDDVMCCSVASQGIALN